MYVRIIDQEIKMERNTRPLPNVEEDEVDMAKNSAVEKH